MYFIDAVSLCCSCEHLGEMVNFPSPSGRAWSIIRRVIVDCFAFRLMLTAGCGLGTWFFRKHSPGLLGLRTSGLGPTIVSMRHHIWFRKVERVGGCGICERGLFLFLVLCCVVLCCSRLICYILVACNLSWHLLLSSCLIVVRPKRFLVIIVFVLYTNWLPTWETKRRRGLARLACLVLSCLVGSRSQINSQQRWRKSLRCTWNSLTRIIGEDKIIKNGAFCVGNVYEALSLEVTISPHHKRSILTLNVWRPTLSSEHADKQS